MLALDEDHFTPEDYNFLVEYRTIMEPVATAIDNLQASMSFYAIYLPTLHSMKYALDELDSKRFVYCTPLVQSIRKGFESRFKRFFNRTDEQCVAATIAAVTHPHFKTRWMHEEWQNSLYMQQIREMLVSKAMDMEIDSNTSNINRGSEQTNNNKKMGGE